MTFPSLTINLLGRGTGPFPLPRIEEALGALSEAQWFSTLASGYNQVLVSEQDRPKTAFCTPFG